ncbi:glycosyltransferase [Microbacterium resistens]|uniref:glycosyltransferase n=1 Tax=Microbacterium resistens TaxID=156977 RepID=UPI0022EFEEE3|nr:glycosyltransferase [Streptomyces sp. MS2A]
MAVPVPSASTTRVSVCMATYNGARFLRPQVESILAQLRPDDEIVVVDDASRDDTVAVLESFRDDRLRIIRNDRNVGYVRTFEHALSLATGDVLLLSDQDDVWTDGRRDALVAAAGETGFAAGDLVLLGDDAPLRSPLTGRPWRLAPLPGHGSLRNELRLLAGDAPYYGCAMAIRRDDALGLVLPFPAYLTESHDLWIATVANTGRMMTHVHMPVLRRRLHEDNASAPRPRGVIPALRSRLLLLRLWREARRRLRSR